MSVPSTLDEDYDMSDFNELEQLYRDFDAPDDVVDAVSGNTGLLVDTYLVHHLKNHEIYLVYL